MILDWLILALVASIIIGATVAYALARKPQKHIEEKPAEKIEEKAEAVEELSADDFQVEPIQPAKPIAPVEEKIEEKIEEVKEEVVEEPVMEEPVSLNHALEKTRSGFIGRIKGLFSGGKALTADEFDELEEILYTSDLGPQTVQRLMDSIDERLSKSEKSDFTAVRSALRQEMVDIFEPVEKGDLLLKWQQSKKKPIVLMIVGVNGAGKTTTIGKLARRLSEGGKKVLVAAGDTFRAAAEDQLKIWSERAQVEIFAPEGVTDPSAVAFDACKLAERSGHDALIIDTAGRLHTQVNLMEELKKMKRVIAKVFPDAPHEILLVLDANSGQNALIQAQSFHEALEVSGVILTKLDGTAKGGVAVGVACELKLPICLIGVGEGINDLRPFMAGEFVDSII